MQQTTTREQVSARAVLHDDFIIATVVTLAVFWIFPGVISGVACERYLDNSPGKVK